MIFFENSVEIGERADTDCKGNIEDAILRCDQKLFRLANANEVQIFGEGRRCRELEYSAEIAFVEAEQGADLGKPRHVTDNGFVFHG